MPELIGEGFSKPPPKFDFDAMGVTDGRVYFYAKGTDYDSSEANFRLHLSKYVEEHGGTYESRTIKNRDGSVRGMEVRFVRDEDPQQAAAAESAPAAAPEESRPPTPSQSPSPTERPTLGQGEPPDRQSVSSSL